MNRIEVTEKIIATKLSRGLKWSEVAAKVGLSKEWVTAACLGQMTLTPAQGRDCRRNFLIERRRKAMVDGRTLQGFVSRR